MLKKFLSATLIFILSVSFSTIAATYQVADPGFEDWSQTFDGSPALGGGSNGANTGKGLWYGANVYKSVSGIEVFGQVVHQTTDAHSGKYAAKLVDTKVGVSILGIEIKEVSPSWVTLGTPWAYLEGTDTNSATAGTDGGIAFTARPDTMAVWIKRVSEGTENINLVYYSWKGTAKSSKYKNKAGKCTATSHTDEESDIRTQTDPNFCGTDQEAKQIAEGAIRTTKQYSNWTQIKVPITYYYNDIPEKMNIILSASNYPEGRRNDGLVEGNYMIIDDLSLIYSSKIQELRFDNMPYTKFNRDVYEYTVLLGEDADVNDIPNITAKRSGRDLTGSEITIEKAKKLGDPTTITVKAEDGSSTTKYTIYFKATESTNSRLANIYVNGTPVSSFNGYVTDYNVILPYGTTEAPSITVDKGHEAQVVEISSCDKFPCKATVKVTAEDKSYVTTYNINFSIGQLTDNTLQDILVGGKSIPGFKPTTNNYVVELPLGTTQEPTIEAVSKYADGEQNIVITRNGLEGTSTIVVTPPSGSARTYKLTYRITESSYSYLQDIKLDGVSLADFEETKTQYNVSLPVGTDKVPNITWEKGDEYQSVELVNEGVNGTSRITVIAQNGSKTIYRITFSVEKSSVNTLKNIFVDGTALAGFSADVMNYEYNISATATSRPVVTWEAADAYQVVTKSPSSEATAPVTGDTKLTVRAQDGSTSVYTITFTQNISSNSKLADLSVAGYNISPAFSPDVTAYTCALSRGTTTVPEIVAVKGDETQVVRIDENGVNGVAKITVKAQSGATTIYTISFSVAVSSDVTLKDILVGGISLEGFDSSVLEYTIVLPAGTTALPTIDAVKNDDTQRVIINRGTVNSQTTIQVIAEDGTNQTYILNFSVEKSANATLKNIMIDGTPIAEFNPEYLDYTYVLAEDAVKCPVVTVEGYVGQTITITSPLVYGTARIEVTPEEGAKNVYTILFTREKSSNNLLSDIQLDGVTISGFDSQVNVYDVVMPVGTTNLPAISYTKGVDSQNVQVISAGLNGATKLNVMAEDGSVNTYVINFTTTKSSVSSLEAILFDGVLLEGFAKDVFEYNVELPFGTTSLPVLSYIKGDDAERVIATIPANVGEAVFNVLSEDELNTTTYKINFYIAKLSNADLNNIFVNGVAIADFAPDKLDYVIDWLSGSTLPTLTYEKADATAEVVVTNNNWAGCSFVVTAQDGTTKTYTVTYNPLKNSVALLSDIMFYDKSTQSFESMSGFESETLEYSIELPWRTAIVPTIQPVPGGNGQRIIIKEGGVEGVTIIEVLAEDGETTKTYKLNFSVEKSSDATLSNIMVGGSDVEGFDPEVFEYVVTLPYGTKQVPTIEYEKAYKDGKYISEQNVIVSEAGLYGTTRLTVMAQDGITGSTYKIAFKVADSGMPNKPALILVGKQAIALQDGVNEYEVELPYGVTELPAISVEKLYAEQEVHIVEKPKSYSVTLVSNQAGVEDVTYNVLFKNAESQAYLTGISAKSLYPAFNKDVTQYVALIDSEEDFLVSVDEDVNEISTEGSTNSKKIIKVKNIANTLDSRTYTVYLHYNGDVIPNGEFTAWENAAKVGVRPVGWKVPGDYVTKDDDKALSATSVASKFAPEETVKNESDNVAVLNTGRVYLNLGGWFPGMMSLSGFSIALANEGKTSTSLSGDGIPFKNTPDNYEVRYNAVSSNNIDNNSVQFGIQFNTMEPVVKTKTTFDNTYKEEKGSFNWKGIKSPNYLNIWFCAGKSLNASDYGYYNNVFAVFSDKWTTCSTMKVDYIRFSYSSAISTIKVNGVSATKNGNAFTANIDANYVGRPEINIVGGVEDQAYDVVWTEETETSYKANIRSYAEDGTYTDYTLVVNVKIVPRELSADNNLVALNVNGADLDLTTGATEFVVSVPASFHQYLDVKANLVSDYASVLLAKTSLATIEDESIVEEYLMVNAVAENGDEKVYSIKLEKEYSADATLKNIAVEGYELAFDAATLTYNVDLGLAEIPAISYEKQVDGQAVELSVADTTTIKVTAENGEATQTYSIIFTREKESTTALLSNLALLNGEAITFDANTFDYSAKLNANEIAQIYYEKAFAADSIIATQNDGIATIEVFNGAELRNTYTLTYTEPLSTNALLTNILVNGSEVENFDPLTTEYEVVKAKGEAIGIEPILAEENQTLEVVFNEDTQTYIITVTAEDAESIKEYKVALKEIIDNNATLKGIYINGVLIDGFSSDVTEYNYTVASEMPKFGTPAMPSITVEAGAEGQTISMQQNGINDITDIMVMAADGTTKKYYSINFNEEKSSYVYLNSIAANYVALEDFSSDKAEYSVNVPVGEKAPVITFEKGDAFQTVTESEEDNIYKLVVTAENGESFTYSITFTTIYTSDASLAGITLDGEMLEGFQSTVAEYSVELPVGTSLLPEIGVISGANNQGVLVITNGVNGVAEIIVTADDNVTSATYYINFSVKLSAVDTLNDILVDGEPLAGFHADDTEYTVLLPVGTRIWPIVSWEVGDEYQTVSAGEEETDMYNKVVKITTLAQDGVHTLTYIVNFVVEKSSNNTLKDIQLDNASLQGFDAQTNNYVVELPIGTKVYPTVTYTEGDVYQTIEQSETENPVSIKVVAEDGSERTYTVEFVILHSSNADLAGLYIDYELVDGFDKSVTEYNYVLPYGTLELPTISYEAADMWQTITVVDGGVNGDYVVNVLAEDGVTTNSYTIHFSVAKSNNALLSSILVGEEVIPNFDEEVFEYTYVLPYGETVVPVVGYVKGMETQEVTYKEAITVNDITMITVLAEDGITTNVYTIKWENNESNNAYLTNIFVDGEALEEFDPTDNEYTIVLPYGTKELPEVAVETGDADQKAVVEFIDMQAVVSVTAQDGTPNEYVITFVIEKSTENRLKNIFVNGAQLEGFDPEILEYEIVYQNGTPIDNVATIENLTYEVFDPIEQVSLVNDSLLLMLQVIAENGDMRTYVINQRIALSSNTALDDILVNGQSLEDFDSNVLEYTYILPFGSMIVPEDITYETSDSTQTVVLSINQLGEPTEIFVTAEDGTKAIYRIHFVVDDFDPSTEPTVDNVCITSMPNGKWKFTTNCANVSLLISTLNGKVMLMTDLEIVDVNIPNICSEEANGFVFDAPEGQVLVYYFIHMNKKTIHSGKFRTTISK